MKKVALLIMLTAACTQRPVQEELRWKKQTITEADERVSDIIAQLKEDCDSTLMQMARKKADSIKKSRTGQLPVKRR